MPAHDISSAGIWTYHFLDEKCSIAALINGLFLDHNLHQAQACRRKNHETDTLP